MQTSTIQTNESPELNDDFSLLSNDVLLYFVFVAGWLVSLAVFVWTRIIKKRAPVRQGHYHVNGAYQNEHADNQVNDPPPQEQREESEKSVESIY